MRERRAAAGGHAPPRAVLRAVLCAALCVLPLTGCQGPAERGTAADTAAAGVWPSGYGAVFLAAGECSSFGAVAPTEVPCGSERAAARVVAREDGRAGNGPPCPATTDFVLHISERRPSGDEDGDGAVSRGYACMRKLQPPHPGDPGGGGGPHTVVGDCVHDIGGGKVREAACAGGGAYAPQFKVVEAVATRAQCPTSTGLYVRLGGERPVGCARPL
ncbi:hypothetical protein [Streptomyces anthocyanicus]|uniref:hypothetical protein n=1 Tax=Streptomyces anthocyanicus TaxID=68174 RepID=UPI0038660211|nr:hypothetical protein OH747_25555 [Streptomyces anthocyanicus]